MFPTGPFHVGFGATARVSGGMVIGMALGVAFLMGASLF